MGTNDGAAPTHQFEPDLAGTRDPADSYRPASRIFADAVALLLGSFILTSRCSQKKPESQPVRTSASSRKWGHAVDPQTQQALACMPRKSCEIREAFGLAEELFLAAAHFCFCIFFV